MLKLWIFFKTSYKTVIWIILHEISEGQLKSTNILQANIQWILICCTAHIPSKCKLYTCSHSQIILKMIALSFFVYFSILFQRVRCRFETQCFWNWTRGQTWEMVPVFFPSSWTSPVMRKERMFHEVNFSAIIDYLRLWGRIRHLIDK